MMVAIVITTGSHEPETLPRNRGSQEIVKLGHG